MSTRDWLIAMWLVAAVLGQEGIANDVLFVVLLVALFVENLLADDKAARP